MIRSHSATSRSKMNETDRDDPTYYPGSSLRTHIKRRQKKDEDPDPEKIPPHLVEGYRILQLIMRVSKFFKQDPNPRDKGMFDYYEVIRRPICFDDIKMNFINEEYTQLPEFVYDVRLLLLNCYRFFGPNAIQTKQALNVEELLEKRLALLSEEECELCSLQATHGKLENVEENAAASTVGESSHFESKLLKSVEKEKSFRIMTRKQNLLLELQRQTEGKEKELLLWERQTLFTQTDHEMMKHMWEIPVIGHFISLARYQLNIQRIPMYEIERMFLMPQASKSLGRLMTMLLSAPSTRLKIHSKPSMPYKLWSKKLAFKVSGWYKMYVKSNNDPQIVFQKLGIEHQFWKVFGNFNPLEKHEYHELTFHQRVFLVKTLCDYILENHKLIRDTVAAKTREFGTCLGTDRTGAKYIFFPQFLNLDIRIYRQNLDPKSWIDRDVDHEAEMYKAKTESDMENVTKEEQKEGYTLYCAPWLEPDPEDFALVADSVEGVRELLYKFCDDDVESIQRLNDSKKGKSNRPVCEVELARRLVSFIEDLETLELKLVMERKNTRAKLYEEYQDFMNRPADFVDPDEAFCLNKKEPIETHDGEVPGTPTQMQPDVPSLEGADLPQRPDAESLQIPDRHSLDALAGGKTLRHRCIENLPSQELKEFFSSDTEEQSSEDGDNWEIPKNRKWNGIKHQKSTPPSQSSKKKESVHKQNEKCEVSAKIKIMDKSKKILLDNSGILSVPSTNRNQALTNLQGRKLDDVISQRKDVKDKAVITGVIGVEIENIKSPSQTRGSLQPLSAGGYKGVASNHSVNIYQHSTNITDSYSLNEETVSPASMPPQNMTQIEEFVILSDESDNDIQVIEVVYNPKLNRNLATKKPHKKNLSQEDGSMGSLQPLSAGGYKGVASTHSANIYQHSTNITDSYSLNEETVSPASMPPQNMTQIEEVVILSDESDNDIEVLEVVYNPKLNRNLATKHKLNKKNLSQEDGSMGSLQPLSAGGYKGVASSHSANIYQHSRNITDSYSLNEETVSTASLPPQNMTQIEEVVISSDESVK